MSALPFSADHIIFKNLRFTGLEKYLVPLFLSLPVLDNSPLLC